MKGYANPSLLITPQELSQRIAADTGRPLVLDLRPPDAYVAGHVPGAIHLDLWGVSLIDTDPAPLAAFMWMIEHVLAGHGVTASTPVVVYDEQSGMRAARAFWFLEYFGHPSVRLLDGGFNAWTRAGLPIARDAGPLSPSDWTGSRETGTIATDPHNCHRIRNHRRVASRLLKSAATRGTPTNPYSNSNAGIKPT